MKPAVLVGIALLLGAAAFAGSGKITKQSISSGGKNRVYYQFLPDLPSDGRRIPLILALHGSGRDGSVLLEKWKKLATAEGIILVGPDAQNSAGWAAPGDGPEFLHDVVQKVAADYPIDPRRVYLFGHSAGACFALAMSMWESQYFAATVVHAGAFRNPTELSSIDVAKRKIPVSIFVGTADPFFPLTLVRFSRDALERAAIPVTLTEIPNHDHDYYTWSAQINRDAWSFLRDKQLPSEPKYEAHRFVQ